MSKLISPVVPRLSCSSPPGQRRVDRLEELIGGERLGQVAIGPDPDARGAVVGVVQRGDHDDRDQVGLAIPLQLSQIANPSMSGSIRSSRIRSGCSRTASRT